MCILQTDQTLEERLSGAQEENKLKEKSVKPSKVNVAKSDGNDYDSSAFSFSITSSVCYSDASRWLLDTGATYHIYPRRE